MQNFPIGETNHTSNFTAPAAAAAPSMSGTITATGTEPHILINNQYFLLRRGLGVVVCAAGVQFLIQHMLQDKSGHSGQQSQSRN